VLWFIDGDRDGQTLSDSYAAALGQAKKRHDAVQHRGSPGNMVSVRVVEATHLHYTSERHRSGLPSGVAAFADGHRAGVLGGSAPLR